MSSFLVASVMLIMSLLRGVNATYHTTPYILGAGIGSKDFSSATIMNTTRKIVFEMPITALASATGSSTVKTNNQDGVPGTKYASICVPNPFRNMGTGTGRTFLNIGSGTVLRAIYGVKKNPTGVGGDLGFVADCESGTGQTLINNVCTATGCVSRYTTGTADWNGAYFVKLGLTGSGRGLDARLMLVEEDNPAE